MRVHRLEIEAFGPFADPVVVDVDAQSADGLFLIHGPTGSGKTSLLDAICFALYADVPGSRSKRGLRSDHARPDAVPRVTLELTAGERRLRITRSPEFQRPKKRGTGTVKVQAMVTLEERRGARWLALSTRHDEVADVVKDALGMGMAQFAKVVLLPQGDFAAFLRATPEDRREVLERLFDITAFSDVEAWLAEARRTAGADAGAAVAALSSVLTRAEDVLTEAGLAGDPDTGPALPATGPAVTGADRSASDAAVSPEGSPGRAVVPPLSQVPPGSVGAHLRDLCALLDARVSTTMAAFDTASGAERAAAEALAAGRALAELRARGTRALARIEALDAAGPGHAERMAAVSAAERAATLAGHLTALDRATDELTDARAAAAAARRSLPPTVTADLDDDDVDAVLSRVHDLDEAAAALAREAEEAALRKRQHDELLERLELLGSRTASTASRLEQDEAERDELALVVQRSASGAGRVSELELRLVGAAERVATLDAAEDDLRRSQALAPRHAELRTAALDRREQLLDLRQRRLDGMAAELARSLTDGDPCPVCGGAEHPAPATVAEPVVADDVAAAEHRLLAAEAELRRVDGEMEALRTSAGTRLALLGDADRPALEGAVVRATQALAAARAEALAHTEAVARLQVLEAAVEASRTALAAVGARADEARAGPTRPMPRPWPPGTGSAPCSRRTPPARAVPRTRGSTRAPPAPSRRCPGRSRRSPGRRGAWPPHRPTSTARWPWRDSPTPVPSGRPRCRRQAWSGCAPRFSGTSTTPRPRAPSPTTPRSSRRCRPTPPTSRPCRPPTARPARRCCAPPRPRTTPPGRCAPWSGCSPPSTTPAPRWPAPPPATPGSGSWPTPPAVPAPRTPCGCG